MTRSLVLVCVLAGCSASPAPQPSAPQSPPAAEPIESIPTGFAQPPPGSAPAALTNPRPAPAPLSLPTTGPECNDRDCPTTAPLYPTEQCRDGIHTGGRGPCVRFASGCNWSGLVCPQPSNVVCKPSDCDLPIPSEWLCPDGTSIGKFTCVPGVRGTCGATYQPCPFTPKITPRPPPPPPPPPKRGCDPLPSDRALRSWSVQETCGLNEGPEPPPSRYIKDLGDGTHIVEVLGNCKRVKFKRCYTKCLPPEARIATPLGDIAVSELRIGAPIWTRDTTGRRIAARVAKLGSVAIDGEHHVARLVLADGRVLVASPEHPVLAGRIQDLAVGERYDGSRIVTLDLVRYTGARTMDVLPDGPTGVYWADGIPLHSTLR